MPSLQGGEFYHGLHFLGVWASCSRLLQKNSEVVIFNDLDRPPPPASIILQEMRKSESLWLVDCFEGSRAEVTDGPFSVGCAPDVDLRVKENGGGSAEVLFRIRRSPGGQHNITTGSGEGLVIFDGQDHQLLLNPINIDDGEDHTLIVAGHPFTFRRGGKSARKWHAAINSINWFVHERGSGGWLGPVAPDEIPIMTDGEPGKFIVLCEGMEQMGFYPHQLTFPGGSAKNHPARSPSGESQPAPQPEISEINTEYGEFTCPVCWFRFDQGDVMSIAVHADLRGDPVLGEEHMLRFFASSFNDRSQPLDALGLVAPELACPHCRRRLPPGFLEQAHHIFSVVGAPSSGKSYYLSVLVKQLQTILFRSFNTSFRDASPADNAVLNDMKNHLFSASKPEDAYLAKTELEGALYETLPRQGRQVRLPKPFIFKLTKRDAPDDGFSVVFYDNAGEHFEPGSNSADSPGAQHIAVASGIFFLFDPLYSPEFRSRLTEAKDPQLENKRSDQQDIILSESEVRMKQILGVSQSEKVATPMAVIIGKSDAWIDLLGPEQLLPIIGGKKGEERVLLSNIKSNSERLRDFLMEVTPAIVANAEEISSDVCYFASSPLGSPPVKFIDSDGYERIGPDPAKLDPQRVEDATLWVLAKIAPSFFPSNASS